MPLSYCLRSSLSLHLLETLICSSNLVVHPFVFLFLLKLFLLQCQCSSLPPPPPYPSYPIHSAFSPCIPLLLPFSPSPSRSPTSASPAGSTPTTTTGASIFTLKPSPSPALLSMGTARGADQWWWAENTSTGPRLRNRSATWCRLKSGAWRDSWYLEDPVAGGWGEVQ